MTKGIYHLHRRKRLHVNLEKFPHPNKWVNRLDKLVLGLAVIGPLVDVPQLVEIYTNKSAEDVSIFTWFFFAFFAIPWLIYGIVHKEKPIIISYSLWIIIDSIIFIGILIYR
jgi:uncharacterized protein with PQ loop repeat